MKQHNQKCESSKCNSAKACAKERNGNIRRPNRPTDLFIPSASTENSQQYDSEGLRPKKAGTILMSQSIDGKVRNVKVKISVYETSFDHYAVVSPDKEVSKDCGYINLRNSTIHTMDNTQTTFQIIPKDCDANALTLSACSVEEVKEWLVAMETEEDPSLTPPLSPFPSPGTSSSSSPVRKLSASFIKSKRKSLPTLVEEE